MKGIQNPLRREKVYRIVIYSKDVVSGNAKDGIYQIDLPDFIQDINKYHVSVEDFTLLCGLSPAGVARTVICEMDMTQPDTYSTSSKTASRALFTLSRNTVADSATSYYRQITSKTYGVPLTDLSFLRTKQARVTLKQADDNVHTDISMGATTFWVMTIVIHPFIEG
jgi:hypothetical protein